MPSPCGIQGQAGHSVSIGSTLVAHCEVWQQGGTLDTHTEEEASYAAVAFEASADNNEGSETDGEMPGLEDTSSDDSDSDACRIGPIGSNSQAKQGQVQDQW